MVIFLYISWIHQFFVVASSFEIFREYLFCSFPAFNARPYYGLEPQTRFTDHVFIFYIAVWSRLQDGYHTERMRCVLGLEVGKVLMFFIVKLN